MSASDTTDPKPNDGAVALFRRTVIGAVLLLAMLVIAAALLEILGNRYVELGYWRSIVIEGGTATRALAPWAFGMSAFAALTAALLLARRGDTRRAFALGVGCATALAALLRVGYVYNRYHVDVNWSWLREWRGLRVPGFLWETEVLLQNGGLVLASALAAYALYRLIWLVSRRVPGASRGVGRLTYAWPAPAIAGAALVSLLSLAGQVRRPPVDSPNFLIVSLDTLRADHLGCYGYLLPTSPVIDALAEESVLFEWAISQAEATLPSHMSLFTSELPSSHGVWNYRYELPDASLTLAEVLREEGYHTAGFVDAGHMLGLFGFSQGFDVYHDRFERLEGSIGRGLDWLGRLGDDDRFLLLVHGYDIHTPYAPWSPHRELFVDPAYAGGFEPTVKAMGRIGWSAREDPDYVVPLTDADRAHIVACYDAAIRWADDLMARLLEGLERLGKLENTWIIVLSDHGEEFLEHGSVEHDKLYHTVTHVPLIVRPPADAWRDDWERQADVRGRRVGTVTSLIDVFPTICDLAGIDAPIGLEGRSLATYLGPHPGGTLEPRVAYSQSWRFGHERAITSDSLHAIDAVFGSRDLEVYAYRRDPLEQRSLTAGASEPDDGTRALARRLVEWMKETGTEMDEGFARRLFGSEFETLRNLGYIQQ